VAQQIVVTRDGEHKVFSVGQHESQGAAGVAKDMMALALK
jgi:hypothetical protein